MLPEKIYQENWEVDARLIPFNFNRGELLEVAQKTLAERSNVLDLDVASAAGTLAYIHGNRHLRLLAVSKGYEIRREKNIEASAHPSTGITITYQNVDAACSARWPKAISGKKSGSAEFIDRAQGSLFTSAEAPNAVNLKSIHALNSAVWYFCMSFEEDSFSAELSLPATIKGDNFYGFYERIFIAKGQQWFGRPKETTDDDFAEIMPKIHRK